jgi:dihydrolipoamide dehydrogenase
LIDIVDELLPQVDNEAVELIKQKMERNGCKFLLGRSAGSYQDGKLILDNGAEIAAEKLLVSVGRKPETGFVADDRVELGKKGQVVVNEFLESSVPGIYAIGDVNMLTQFAHAATYQGIKVVENLISGEKKNIDLTKIPAVFFTSPQLAYVGKIDGEDQEIKKLPVAFLGKAQAENKIEGFLKLFLEKGEKGTGTIQGVVLVAENADSLIGEGVVLVNKSLKFSEIFDMVHPHPTMSELFWEIAK